MVRRDRDGKCGTGAEECTVAEPQKPNLLIACGALANEIVALQRLNGWDVRLHVTCLLRDQVPTRGVVERAAKLGVAVDGLDIFAAERPAPPGLVLGFGRVEAARMDEAVQRLVQAIGEAA